MYNMHIIYTFIYIYEWELGDTIHKHDPYVGGTSDFKLIRQTIVFGSSYVRKSTLRHGRCAVGIEGSIARGTPLDLSYKEYPEQGSFCSQVISRSALNPHRGRSTYVLSISGSKQSKENPIGFTSQRCTTAVVTRSTHSMVVLPLRRNRYHNPLPIRWIAVRILHVPIGWSTEPKVRGEGEVQRLVLQDLPDEVEDIEQGEDQVQGEDLREQRTRKLMGKGEPVNQVEVDNPINQSLRLKKS